MGVLLPVLARNRSAAIVFMVNDLTGAESLCGGRKGTDPVGVCIAGGKREGGVVYALSGVGGLLGAIFSGTPFGEIDNTITARLKRLVGIFNQAGLDAKVSTRVADYLFTHAGFVTLMVGLAIKYKVDMQALARNKAYLGLLVDALRELFQVLRHPRVPGSSRQNSRSFKPFHRSLMAAALGHLSVLI